MRENEAQDRGKSPSIDRRQAIRCLIVSACGGGLLTALYAVLFPRLPGRAGVAVRVLIQDGVAVAGVLLLIIGFFGYFYSKGYFDWIGYVRYIFRYLVGRKKATEFVNYFDYTDAKEHGGSMLWITMAVGAGFIAAGAAMIALCA